MNPQTAPLFLDLSHTSHTRARTGIQRVSRAILRELAGRTTAVCFDPHEDAWRPLESWEERNLAATDPASGRGSHWPLAARLRGRIRRVAGRTRRLGAEGAPSGGVIVPEIFSAAVAGALPRLFAASTGPRVAVFHDAIALQFPEHTPRSTSARFPGYMRELLQFDGVAAVSGNSRDSLLEYWRWLGVPKAPPVEAISLGIDAPAPRPAPSVPGAVPTVLCVGSIEGRKNHMALLEACEALWSREAAFTLRLVGLASKETGGPALGRIEQLKAMGRPIHYGGPANDEELEAAYSECSFTIYPSVAEGFGLPVAESLVRGKVCLCRVDGATGEIARGGGCLGIGEAGASEIAAAIGLLLASPFDLATLESEARARRLKSWSQYATELLAWMGSLRRDV
jgi:glycosyltransferase involved in cell wall biosynthesis